MKPIILNKMTYTESKNKNLNRYFEEIGKTKLLTSEEMSDLVPKIKNGDKNALDKLVISNLRFVVSVAKRYIGLGLPLLDLINEGNLGLIEAAKRFDDTKKIKFISYAVWRIRSSILSAIKHHGRTIRITVDTDNNLQKILSIQNDFESVHQRSPSLGEIQQVLETLHQISISQQDILFVLETKNNTDSLDAPMSSDNSSNSLKDIYISDDFDSETFEKEDSFVAGLELILSEIESYSERDQRILRLHFGFDTDLKLTKPQIADMVGLSHMRVTQIIKKFKDSFELDSQKKHLLFEYLA